MPDRLNMRAAWRVFLVFILAMTTLVSYATVRPQAVQAQAGTVEASSCPNPYVFDVIQPGSGYLDNWNFATAEAGGAIPYYVHSSFSAAEVAAIDDAVEQWEAVTSTLNFYNAGTTDVLSGSAQWQADEDAGIRYNLFSPDDGYLDFDGQGGVGLNPNGPDPLTGGVTLGVAEPFFPAHFPNGGMPLDADTGEPVSWTFTVTFDRDVASSLASFADTALHEFGHAIFLGHTVGTQGLNIMDPIEPLVLLDGLQAEDIACARHLYGAECADNEVAVMAAESTDGLTDGCVVVCAAPQVQNNAGDCVTPAECEPPLDPADNDGDGVSEACEEAVVCEAGQSATDTDNNNVADTCEGCALPTVENDAGECVDAPPVCGANQTAADNDSDGVDDACVCNAGFQESTVTGDCVLLPNCNGDKVPVDTTGDGVKDSCGCPAGQTTDDFGYCVTECVAPQVLVNSVCVTPEDPTVGCEEGQVPPDGGCTAAPVCDVTEQAADTTGDGVLDGCVCRAGFQASTVTGECLVPKTCTGDKLPADTNSDGVNDTCECPAGQTTDEFGNCVTEPTCVAPQVLQNGACVTPVDPAVCPDGQLPTNDGGCALAGPVCDDTQDAVDADNNGVSDGCVCRAGFQESTITGECLVPKTCFGVKEAVDTNSDGVADTCACPAGQITDDFGNCVVEVTCVLPQVLENGACVTPAEPPVDCTGQGVANNANICVDPPPACDAGDVATDSDNDGVNDQCVAPPAAPEPVACIDPAVGADTNGDNIADVCVTPVVCDDGVALNDTNNDGVADTCGVKFAEAISYPSGGFALTAGDLAMLSAADRAGTFGFGSLNPVVAAPAPSVAAPSAGDSVVPAQAADTAAYELANTGSESQGGAMAGLWLIGSGALLLGVLSETRRARRR